MSMQSIDQLRTLMATAEELIGAGYGIFTIYADQNEIHAEMDISMPAPCAIETVDTPAGKYDHCHGKIGSVTITWLVEKRIEVAA